jgi:hypothetical protein
MRGITISGEKPSENMKGQSFIINSVKEVRAIKHKRLLSKAMLG